MAFATKMLYRAPWVFINGEHFVADGVDAEVLQQLANQRALSAEEIGSITKDSELWAVWHDWYEQGWFLAVD